MEYTMFPVCVHCRELVLIAPFPSYLYAIEGDLSP